MAGKSTTEGPNIFTNKASETNKLSDRQILEMLVAKVDQTLRKLDTMESQMKVFDTRLQDLENGVSFMEQEYEHQKDAIKQLEETVSKVSVEQINKKLTDLENYTRRNNVVIRNLPEGSEKEEGCQAFVERFVKENLELNIEIEVAHRTPGYRTDRTRIIHARCLRRGDREKILQSSKKLKGKKFGGNSVYITDDVNEATRKQEKKLLEKVKELRQEGKIAFMPYSTPRVVKYKEKGESRYKTLNYRDVEGE